MTKAELRAAIATLAAHIEALPDDPPPWPEPMIDPAMPVIADDVAAYSGPRIISSAASMFVAQAKRIQDTGLAFKLQATSFGFDEMLFEDIELARCAVLFRCYGVGAIRNLTMRRIRAINGAYASGRGMGLFTSSNTWLTDALFEDLTYVGAQPCTSSSDIPAVIALQGKDPNDGGERITIRNFRFENLITQYDGYPNADGIAVERGYRQVLVENGLIRNVSDAGVDFKAADSRINNVIVEQARESFKLWSPGVHGALFSRDPTVAHVQVMGSERLPPDQPIVIEHLSARSSTTAAVLRFENGPATVIVKSHDLSGLQPGTPLVQILGAAAGSKVVWEQGEPR